MVFKNKVILVVFLKYIMYVTVKIFAIHQCVEKEKKV